MASTVANERTPVVMKYSNIKGVSTHFLRMKDHLRLHPRGRRLNDAGLVAEFSPKEKTLFEASGLGAENIFFSDSSRARPSRIRNYQVRSPDVESLRGGLGSRY